MARELTLEVQALRKAQKVDDKTFSHIFGGTGYINFESDDLRHPTLIVNLGKVGALIYKAVKTHSLDFYYKSYTKKFGKNVVPKELIERAYEQCAIDPQGRLQFTLDFDNSEGSINQKYQGKPEVRLMDDLIFKDEPLSPLLPAFFHLFNTRLKNGQWVVMAISMQYVRDEKKISFEEFTKLLKEIQTIK